MQKCIYLLNIRIIFFLVELSGRFSIFKGEHVIEFQELFFDNVLRFFFYEFRINGRRV